MRVASPLAHRGHLNELAHISPYADAAHRGAVIALWESAFGYAGAHNAPGFAIDQKVAAADGLFFVALLGGQPVGTIMAGYDGHRGWLYSLAVAAAHRRGGIGTALVRHAEAELATRGCAKINLQVLPANASVTGFYRALGYAVEERVSMGKRLLG